MKETKPKAQPSRDPEIGGFSYDEFYSNQLSLSEKIKKSLKDQGLTWRFINAQQFRNAGNVHRSHWKVHIFPEGPQRSEYGCTPEGVIQRGDLVLATRKQEVADAHRKFLNKRNKLQNQFNKSAADDLRKTVREAGLEDQAKIHEGYDEND